MSTAGYDPTVLTDLEVENDLDVGGDASIEGDLDVAGALTAPSITAPAVAITVANKTGGSLAKGTLVYPTGYDATLGAISVTEADADTGGKQAAFVLPAAIANNASGLAYAQGVVSGIDTSSASAVGSLVYLSATAGEFAFSAPSGADQIVQIVGVVTVKHASTGAISFFPGIGYLTKIGTSAIQDDAITAAKTDTATAGTAEASKIAVLGTNKNLDELHLAALYLGAAAGTQMTASAAELNICDADTAGGVNQTATATTLHKHNLAQGAADVTASAAQLNLLGGAAAGIAAVLAGGLGGSVAFTKTSTGANDLLAAHATKARACLIVCVVTETFADNTGAQTVVTVGEEGALTKFVNTELVGATAGDVLVFAGTNDATEKVQANITAATGDGTGAVTITVLGIPTT